MRITERMKWVGWDGLNVLVLSNLAIALTGGLSWLWQVRRVYRTARRASCEPVSDTLIVLGMRLHADQVAPDYAQRLERARALWERDRGRRILILGGHTGAGALSEAEAGRRYLVARGVPDAVLLLEDASRHTLENLQGARGLLGEAAPNGIAMITNRYHLERTRAFAQGMGLAHRPCAAEERLSLDLKTLGRIAKEAYLVHWYYVGRTWSTWTRNQKSLNRIS